jgi:sec-independent protein translocase protein TatB
VFDIGGLELLVIVVVALVAIGPKELPGALRTAAMWMRRMREMARDFQAGFEELTREAGVEELKRDVQEAVDTSSLEATAQELHAEFEKSIDPEIHKMLGEVDVHGYPGSPLEALAQAEEAGAEPLGPIGAGGETAEPVPAKSAPAEPPPGATGN